MLIVKLWILSISILPNIPHQASQRYPSWLRSGQWPVDCHRNQSTSKGCPLSCTPLAPAWTHADWNEETEEASHLGKRCLQCFGTISDVAYQVKLLLKLFVCIVDTKLFKAVDVKGFKAEDEKGSGQKEQAERLKYLDLRKKRTCELPVNVQNTYESVLLSWDLERCVYPANDAVKQMGVDLLGQGISGAYCSVSGYWLYQRLCQQNNPAMAQPTRQPLCTHIHQLPEDCQMGITELKDIQINSLMLNLGLHKPKNRLRELRLTGTDDLSSPVFFISTFPKCRMDAKTLKTSDWKSSFNPEEQKWG